MISNQLNSQTINEVTMTPGKIPDRIAAELRYLSIIRDQRFRMYDIYGALQAIDLYNLVYNRWYEAQKHE